MNQCFVQLTGPFVSSQDIMSILKNRYDFSKVVKLGIQAKAGRKCMINGESVEIGKTGIYEINDVDITSFSFSQNENESTIIDFVVE